MAVLDIGENVARVHPVTEPQVQVVDDDEQPLKSLRHARADFQRVFQDPYCSLSMARSTRVGR